MFDLLREMALHHKMIINVDIIIVYTMVWGNTQFWLAAGCPLTPDIWTPTK